MTDITDIPIASTQYQDMAGTAAIDVDIGPEELMRLVKRLSIVMFNSRAKISKLKILPNN